MHLDFFKWIYSNICVTRQVAQVLQMISRRFMMTKNLLQYVILDVIWIFFGY